MPEFPLPKPIQKKGSTRKRKRVPSPSPNTTKTNHQERQTQSTTATGSTMVNVPIIGSVSKPNHFDNYWDEFKWANSVAYHGAIDKIGGHNPLTGIGVIEDAITLGSRAMPGNFVNTAKTTIKSATEIGMVIVGGVLLYLIMNPSTTKSIAFGLASGIESTGKFVAKTVL